jgi:hypothetical protein
MTKPTVINVLFRSGQRQNIACANHDDAARIWLQISDFMAQGLPVIAIEDSTTAIVLAVGEVACVALGGDIVPVQVDGPQRIERPAPQPVRRPEERGVMIAN